MAAAEEASWPGRLVPDASVRTLEGGRVLVGGSPLCVLRFSAPVAVDSVTSAAVVDRLVDTGMAHPEPSAGPFTAADVTVVIPVFGHADALSATLASLARQPERLGGVVVVDDGSADPDAIAATVALAGLPGARLVRSADNRGPAAARNLGLDAVTTPLVAFLDAGCVVQQGWLAPLLAQFADARLALAAPRVRADPDRWSDAGPTGSTDEAARDPRAATWSGMRRAVARWVRRRIARYEVTRSPLDLGPQPARITPRTRVAYVPSACVVARVDELRRVGGFDEELRVGEDVDLVWRLAADRRLRYVPAAHVTHDVRTRPGGWLRRRFAYGTSAAPLAVRHPGGPTPVSVSGWSAAAWAAVAAGQPLVGVGVAAVSTGLLVRKLGALEHPVGLALRLAGLGNLAAGGLLADAVRRAWWPVALPAALLGPRALRRTVLAAWILPPLARWRPATGLDPVTWLVLCTADDLAYGAGVWAGCVRTRTVAPLVPDLGAGKFT